MICDHLWGPEWTSKEEECRNHPDQTVCFSLCDSKMSITAERAKCHCAEIKQPSTMFLINFGELPSSRMYTMKRPCNATLHVSVWPERIPFVHICLPFSGHMTWQTRGRAAQNKVKLPLTRRPRDCKFQFRNKNVAFKRHILTSSSWRYFYIFAPISILASMPSLCWLT